MKKKYVKPVMESEEFVANEYVAACWRVICKGGNYLGDFNHKAHGEVIYVGDTPVFDNYDRNGDGFVNYVVPNYGDAYSGIIGGVEGPHPVTVIKKGDGNGPNASV